MHAQNTHIYMYLIQHTLPHTQADDESHLKSLSNSTIARQIPYGVATISRLLKMTGLFCRILSLLQGFFAKETYNFKEPTNRSHPISRYPE